MADGAGLDWIFFDAGNTLIALDYARLTAVLAAAGLSADESALRRAETAARRELDRAILESMQDGGIPGGGSIDRTVWRDHWRRVLGTCGARRHQEEALLEVVFAFTAPAASWDRVEPSTRPVLDALSAAGYRLGVISNSSGTLKEHLDRIGLASRFEVIVDSHEVGVEKPHPEIFRHALRLAGDTAPGRALHVGDVYAIDVVGATGVGMEAVLFDPAGVWHPAALPGDVHACRTIGSLEDLPSLLRT